MPSGCDGGPAKHAMKEGVKQRTKYQWGPRVDYSEEISQFVSWLLAESVRLGFSEGGLWCER